MDEHRDPDPNELMKDARHLAKYIFPLQFGLANVFATSAKNIGNAVTTSVRKYPDWEDREKEVKVSFLPSPPKHVTIVLQETFNMHSLLTELLQAKGSVKTPKRLKSALALCEKMLWYHGKCGYKPLLDKVCPSKLDKATAGQGNGVDSSVILVCCMIIGRMT
jgi:hypothetical protein